MSGPAFAVAGAAITVGASPYLARLVVSVPDRANRRWWTGAAPGARRQALTSAVALVLGVLAGLAGTAAGWATLPALLALALTGTALAVIDIETHRLPDRLVGVAAGGAVVLLALAAAAGDHWPAYLRAVEAAAAVFAVLFAITLAAPRSFGFGDVKLGGVLGAYLGWTGWPAVFYGIFAGFVLGTAVALVLLTTGRATRKTPVPFGPMLVVGAFAVLALTGATSLLR
jgi:leader peptidase (prepilin peptidase)/N-methyltransferase